jgi:hypothetical protein
VGTWAKAYAGRSVAVVCTHGAKLSQGVAAWLRHAGAQAEYLEGGFAGWTAANGLLVQPTHVPQRDAEGRTLWVTRTRPKIDRIACPWLIRRFIDLVMGDLVLTESEISPVMKQLLGGGIEITALHNHLLRAQPATFYMHVLGHGDPVKLATALHEGLALSKTPLVNTPSPAAGAAPKIDLDTAMIDQTLGGKGQIAGGVYQVNIRRAETIRDGAMSVPVAMGSAEAMNFQPTGDGKAATTGDLVLTAQEVNPALRALRDSGIEVTALHNHMLDDEPRLFFMHFWANDDAAKLAKGLKSALDKINVARS